MKEVRIENWYLMSPVLEVMIAPERNEALLGGEVYGHEKFPDGKHIHTSNIVEVIAPNKVKTRNTLYILGRVDSTYESFYANATERMIEHRLTSAFKYFVAYLLKHEGER
jgi:hypothetical protein